MLSGSATSQALCQCGQLIKMSGMYWGATQTTSESEGLKKRSSLMFFEVHILFFPCPDLYAPAFTLSSTYRLSLVTNSRLREENLSFPSVERTLGVLLLWAKPLSFYPEAIDGRCWRGCLSFVFLSELQGEVGHLEGERTGVWGRDTRRNGGRLTERRKSRKAEHLVPREAATFTCNSAYSPCATFWFARIYVRSLTLLMWEISH